MSICNNNQTQSYTLMKGGLMVLDSDLLETIYRQNYKSVYNYICFRINNHFDAEELASLVFEKAMRKWSSFDSSRPIEAWLIGIAKNTTTDYLRSKMRRSFVAWDNVIGLVSPNRQPEAIAVINESNRALISAMAKLKKKERQILSMKFATELKHSEIAEILSISESNVAVIAHRALKKLREYLDKENDL